jgi:ferredoxin
MMKLDVDQDVCVAAGQCVVAAPSVFDQRDEDGVVLLRTPVPPAGETEAVARAAAACPAQAIRVTH